MRPATRLALARPAPLRAATPSRSLHVPAARPAFGPRARPAARAVAPLGRRAASTPAGTAAPRGGLRVSHLFAGLAGLGALVTIYGLLEYYTSLSTWPEPVRTPLKAALKARNRGDIDVARQYFEKAIDAALALPPSALAPAPLLKLSGIHISLSAMLESESELVGAYTALAGALAHFGPAPLAAAPPASGGWADQALGPGEVTRAIGLCQKLGQLALRIGSAGGAGGAGGRALRYPLDDGLGGWDGAAEKYLADAVAAMLRLGLANRAAGGAVGVDATPAQPAQPGQPAQPVVAGRDLDLAVGDDEGGRVDLKGLATTMESLAEVYARKGQDALAAQLLVQAISILVPPGDEPSALATCRAALLMTTVSSYALGARSAREVAVARSWAAQALERAAAVPASTGVAGAAGDEAVAVCARARSVGLYNLGMLAEIEAKPADAAKYFTQAARSAGETGFAEGRRRALDALRRVQPRADGQT